MVDTAWGPGFQLDTAEQPQVTQASNIKESFGQPLGRSSTEVRLPRSYTKPPQTCDVSDHDVEIGHRPSDLAYNIHK